ncbi:MAG: hypothetical protein K1X56_07940 [Flavobacteriales bacterium]|nr:hypothetical protein [Flavobacteriales bacterium]
MRLPIFIFLSLLLFSCKKDNFKGDYHELVGTWNWIYTQTLITDNVGVVGIGDTIYPADVGYSYSIEFHENGRISFYQNGNLNECWRKNCIEYWHDYGSKVEFWINHNCNDSDADANLTLYRPDTIVIPGFRPFETYSDGHYGYIRGNCFLKE